MKTIPLGTYGQSIFKRTVWIPLPLPHIHILGVTDTGKSRFIANLFLSLYKAGVGTTLIDPTGNLAKIILANLIDQGVYEDPRSFERIMYLDFAAAEREEKYLPFNILKQDVPAYRIAKDFKDALHRAFPELDAMAPANFDTLLPRAIRAFIRNNIPLTSLEDFFLNKNFRDRLLSDGEDRNALNFFKYAYEQMGKRDQLNMSGSVMRRGVLLTDEPIVAYSFSQPTNTFNFQKIMDGGKFLLINLGGLSRDVKQLFGCLISVGIEQSALERANPARLLTDHVLIIDEMGMFISKSAVTMETILSQARQYNLHIALAHQTWSQATEQMRGAIQNAGMEIAFKQGREDAEYTAPIIGRADMAKINKNKPPIGNNQPYFTLWEEKEEIIQSIQDLPQRHFYARIPARKRTWLQRLLLGRSRDFTTYLKSIDLPNNDSKQQKIREVEQTYIRRYFREPVEHPPPVFSPRRKRSRPLKKKAIGR